jgi:hypothetical protein
MRRFTACKNGSTGLMICFHANEFCFDEGAVEAGAATAFVSAANIYRSVRFGIT